MELYECARERHHQVFGRRSIDLRAKKTSLHFENGNKQSTTVFDNLPKEYKEPLMKAIVAFEIEVTDMQNVFKLSQNRDQKSYETIHRNFIHKEEMEKKLRVRWKKENQIRGSKIKMNLKCCDVRIAASYCYEINFICTSHYTFYDFRTTNGY
jgi:hypothetical protein